MHLLFQYLQNFSELLYPKLCGGCGNHLYENEEVVCVYCRASLPLSSECDFENNASEKLFWGKVSITAAASFLFFQKKSSTQHLLHQLKYQQKENIGEWLGEQFAYSLQSKGRFAEVEIIIPIPLHPSRIKFRGYNQCDAIARGMASVLQIPIVNGVLIRSVATQSQTKKNRFQRFENMESVFSLAQASTIKGKNILLLDDVLTTGATLVSAAQVLAKAGVQHIYIGAIAKA
jgi:ComF family protein